MLCFWFGGFSHKRDHLLQNIMVSFSRISLCMFFYYLTLFCMKNIVSVLVHAAAVALASLSVSLAARSSVSSTADSAKGVCGRPKWKIKFHSARWFYNNLKIVSQIAVKSQLCGRNCGNSRNFKLPDSQGATMLTWKLKPLHMREFPVCYCFDVPATGL